MKTNAYIPLPDMIRKAAALAVAVLGLHAGPALGGVQDLASRYEGAWTNTTFDSTGKAVIEIQVSGSSATLNFDMDGFVFGMMDPPVITMPGTVSGDVIQIDNQGVGMFGDIKGSVDAAQKTFSATLTNIPGGFIDYVTTVGTIDGGVIDLDYTVYFPGPTDPFNPAFGVLVARKVQPFTITRVARQGQDLLLEWVGGQGPFQVQTCTNLTAPVWLDAGSPTGNQSTTLPAGEANQMFYRVVGQ